MKRCPSCQRTYPDDTKFCLQDGAPLADAPASFGSTFGREGQPAEQPPPVHQAPAGGGAPPPPNYAAQGWQQPTAPRKRKVWPWVVGGVVVVGMGLVVVGIVAAVFIARRASNSTVNVNVNAGVSRRANTNNSGIPGPPHTSNTNNDDDTGVSGLDRQAVMTELSKLENEWIRANIKADKKALERILADEYRGVAGDGTEQTKADYIATVQPDRTARSWSSEDVTLEFEGDKAVISGVLIWNSTDGTRRYRFTDSFVRREGRWQAVSSVTTPESDN